MTIKLGLDTGGTYTDAVIFSESSAAGGSGVLSNAKSLTTHHDLSIGLRAATNEVLSAAPANISLVSLSTTLATNALVEGRGRSVCLVLIGYTPKQLARARLKEALGSDPMGFIAGGHDASGHAVAELDLCALEALVAQQGDAVEAFAVSGMFAVRNPEHEITARNWIREKTGKPVSCGYELSSGLDAPRRALTAVLNARLIPLIKNLLNATADMLTDFGIDAPVMVVKGDGSLVSAAFAANSPVETILSGPAASVVGARYLSGADELVVSDMGGTTTDVALLRNGVPRIDPNGATVGGWATMVRAVRINTYGLGGDSAVLYNRELRDFSVGPHRVMPLCVFMAHYPTCHSQLQAQLELPFSTTHSAQFVYCNRDVGDEPTALTAQQRELWDRIILKPIAVQTLFEDQTLERALQKLITQGYVMMSGFTPSDASLICGEHLTVPVGGELAAQSQDLPSSSAEIVWHAEAAQAGARLLMRYSQQNLGKVWSSELQFASMIREKVSRLSAMAVLETVLCEDRGHAGGVLPKKQRQLIDEIFTHNTGQRTAANATTNSVSLGVQMRQPVMGIGAPAISYYPRVAELLGTTAEVPEYAGVANALGAVVGTVSQNMQLTITPAGGKRVVVHAEAGPVEFDSLEHAADWARQHLEEEVQARAADAGAVDLQLSHERKDTVVDNEGEIVFFESSISVVATGRPATAVDTKDGQGGDNDLG